MCKQSPRSDTHSNESQAPTGSSATTDQASEVSPTSFTGHLASLPTLDDLAAEFRAEDPAFANYILEAEQELYQSMLAEVEKGQLSRITAERLRLGISQAALAQQVGIEQTAFSRFEIPGATIPVSSAQRIAAELGVADYRELLPS